MIDLAENSYGKSCVRVMKVARDAAQHSVKEWKVEVLLSGDFASCFARGDNSAILATDTMKNTVYSLARKSQTATMEEFAQEMVEFLLARNPPASGYRDVAESDARQIPCRFATSSGVKAAFVSPSIFVTVVYGRHGQLMT